MLVFEKQNREENWMQDSIMFTNAINRTSISRKRIMHQHIALTDMNVHTWYNVI